MKITRYPPTKNKSLRAWSAADEYILKVLSRMEISGKNIVICNDRFGYLATHLHQHGPYSVIAYKSQKTSLLMNLQNNGIQPDHEKLLNPLEPVPVAIDVGLMIVPKSLELFRFYLQYLHRFLKEGGTVVCGFMTRHFTTQILSLAGACFEEVDQSLAWKKSRVLILKGKKPDPGYELTETIPYIFSDGIWQDIIQYSGVFSSGNIDYATQFLLDHLFLQQDENIILDLGCGNGVIARAIQLKKPNAELHLLDDFFLAIESSRQNLQPENVHFHWSDSVDDIGNVRFDLAVSNPPFHFEHEVNTEVSINLFREVAGKLKPGGRFLCVANKHLGYQSSLKKFFTTCNVLAESNKYIIYECIKGVFTS